MRGEEPVDQQLVEVLAAEMVVAGGGAHLDHAIEQLENRNVERAAAQVEHEEPRIRAFLVDAVGERGSGRFVQQTLDLEPGELPGAPRGLSLLVVEIGRDGDHRIRDRLRRVPSPRLP